MADHLRAELVLDALEMALWSRDVEAGSLVAHSDRGSQYTSFAYTSRLHEAGIAPSVGSVGDAFDNAMAESLNGSYKWELVKRRRWTSRIALELATVEWIGWYNDVRLHREIGDVPPAECEAEWRTKERGAYPDRTQVASTAPNPGGLTERTVHLTVYVENPFAQSAMASGPANSRRRLERPCTSSFTCTAPPKAFFVYGLSSTRSSYGGRNGEPKSSDRETLCQCFGPSETRGMCPPPFEWRRYADRIGTTRAWEGFGTPIHPTSPSSSGEW
jgi:hypothetical protein